MDFLFTWLRLSRDTFSCLQMRGTSGNYLRNGNPISILLKTTSRKIAKGRIERQKVPHPNSRCSNSQLCGVRWSYFAPSERMPALTDQKARIFGTSLDHMLTSPCCCTAKRSRRHLFANLPCLLVAHVINHPSDHTFSMPYQDNAKECSTRYWAKKTVCQRSWQATSFTRRSLSARLEDHMKISGVELKLMIDTNISELRHGGIFWWSSTI